MTSLFSWHEPERWTPTTSPHWIFPPIRPWCARRAFASERLAAWGLEDMAFTTELVVSELVTNAIRYGRSPIQLRMILQPTVTCEVSDASGTAPHLRRARTFDEGGRGLFLVAQLSEHWGTRHHREGKVIWAEQLIPPAGAA